MSLGGFIIPPSKWADRGGVYDACLYVAMATPSP